MTESRRLIRKYCACRASSAAGFYRPVSVLYLKDRAIDLFRLAGEVAREADASLILQSVGLDERCADIPSTLQCQVLNAIES